MKLNTIKKLLEAHGTLQHHPNTKSLNTLNNILLEIGLDDECLFNDITSFLKTNTTNNKQQFLQYIQENYTLN